MRSLCKRCTDVRKPWSNTITFFHLFSGVRNRAAPEPQATGVPQLFYRVLISAILIFWLVSGHFPRHLRRAKVEILLRAQGTPPPGGGGGGRSGSSPSAIWGSANNLVPASPPDLRFITGSLRGRWCVCAWRARMRACVCVCLEEARSSSSLFPGPPPFGRQKLPHRGRQERPWLRSKWFELFGLQDFPGDWHLIYV